MEKREDDLTGKDKRLLRIQAISTLVIGLAIGGVAFYMLFLSDSARSLGFPVYMFAFFFFGILAFILFIRFRAAFQQVKNVYSGIITDKREHTMTTRHDLGQTTYTVQLDDRTFPIDQALYNQVHRGDLVELHCLKGNLVFKVNILQPAKAVSSSFSSDHSNEESTVKRPPEPTISNRSILIRLLLRACLFRVVIGGIIAYFLLFGLNMVVLITLDDMEQLLFWIDTIFYGTIFLLMLLNIRTVRLLLDLITQKTRTKIETIVDMQSGNLPKPSKNTVSTYQGYYYRNDLFYYVQTEKHWLEISGTLYESLQTGNSLLLTCGYFSGEVLQLEKTSLRFV